MNLKSNKKGAIVIEGHVQGLAITRSLGQKGIPVIVIDTKNCIARYSKYCNKYYTCPHYLDNKFIDFLIDIYKRDNLQDWVLYPTNDYAVYNISKNRNILLNYFKVSTPSFEIVNNIYNKKKL